MLHVMNRFSLHIISAFLVISGLFASRPAWSAAFSYIPVAPDMRWAYSVIEDPSMCRIQMSGATFDVLQTPDGVSLGLPGTTAWTKPGQPRLPVFPAVFSLGTSVTYTVEVRPGETRTSVIGNLLPESVQVSISDNDASSRVEEQWQPDASIYQTDAFWPEIFYEVDEARGGGERYLRIGVMPFRYNPVSGTLEYFPDLTVTIVFHDPDSGGQ